MKKICKKIKGITKVIIVVMLLSVILFPQTAFAASVSISASGGTIETGDTVTVTVSLSSSSTIGAFRLYLRYDSSVIEYVPSSGDDSFCNGGSGQLVFVGDPYSTSASYSVKFKGVTAGTSNLTISYDPGDILDDSYNDMSVSASSGKVTVNAPREASSDATLSSLRVGEGALSPTFSSDVTEYNMSEVSADVESLTISAVANSQYATVSIRDNYLDEGENTVRVVVTAENGDQKTYYIYVTRAEATPSPTPEPTPTPTETPIPTPGVEITAKVFGTDESGNAVVSEKTYTISDVITASIPAGFDKTTVTISGAEVEALKLNDGDLTLIQLSDGELYIYDSISGVCSKYQTVNIPARNYRIDTAPAELIPSGYFLTALEINGVQYPVYANSGDAEFVLMYVDGNSWYRYDTAENTLQRYILTSGNENPNGGTTAQNPTDISPTSPVNEEGTEPASTIEHKSNNSDLLSKIRLIITILVFVSAIVFMVLFVRERNRNLMYIAAEKEEQMADFDEDSEEYSDYEAAFLKQSSDVGKYEDDYEAEGSELEDEDEFTE